MMQVGVGLKSATVFWNQLYMSQVSSGYHLSEQRVSMRLNCQLSCQVSHAMCMKTEAEMYRRLESDCDRDDGGCTGGSLFWVSLVRGP